MFFLRHSSRIHLFIYSFHNENDAAKRAGVSYLVAHPKSSMLLVFTVDFACQRPENINCQSRFERQSYIFDSNQQTLLTTLYRRSTYITRVCNRLKFCTDGKQTNKTN